MPNPPLLPQLDHHIHAPERAAHQPDTEGAFGGQDERGRRRGVGVEYELGWRRFLLGHGAAELPGLPWRRGASSIGKGEEKTWKLGLLVWRRRRPRRIVADD